METMELEKKKKEEKDKKLKELRIKYERSLVDSRKKLMQKILDIDKKIKNQKEEQEKQLQKKYNEINMSREDRKNRVLRMERAKDFERTQKMEMIEKRMERIDNMQKDKNLIEEERRRIENDIKNRKTSMFCRLQKLYKNDKNLSKDQILDYVINDIRPKSKSHYKTKAPEESC